jgi:hypothetical protein
MSNDHELLATGSSYTWSWATGAADRALKSFAQALVLLLGGGTTGLNILQVDWKASLAAAVGAAILSLLTSVISAPLGDAGTTSLLPGGK